MFILSANIASASLVVNLPPFVPSDLPTFNVPILLPSVPISPPDNVVIPPKALSAVSKILIVPIPSTATVTFKCVPYTIEDTENFISLLQSKRSLKGIRGLIEKSLGRTWRKLWRNIWLTAARYINRNRNEDVSVMYPTDPGDKVWLDIKYAPDHDDLLDKKVMAKRMREYGPVQGWASLVIISTDDFPEGFDMIKFFKDYRRLAYTSGFGDIVIIDPDKEAVNFCSLALLSCQRLSFSYLSKVINLPNVIDFNNAKKYERPFNVSPKRI